MTKIAYCLQVIEILILSVASCRILDNLPLVVPIRRLDQESSIVYQHGFHVGLKGLYAGVSTRRIRIFPPIAADFRLFFSCLSQQFL